MLPISDSNCFFITIFAFAVMGFMRGWKKEVLSLLFILIAAFLVRPNGDQSLTQMIARVPAALSYLFSNKIETATTTTTNTASFLGPWGALLAFALIAALGYYLGEKAFPKPATPTERILGIIPALGAAALLLSFLRSGNFFTTDQQGHTVFSISMQPPDPTQFVPILLVIAILVVIGGLIAARSKKASAPKK
jgi:hypothetical protein